MNWISWHLRESSWKRMFLSLIIVLCFYNKTIIWIFQKHRHWFLCILLTVSDLNQLLISTTMSSLPWLIKVPRTTQLKFSFRNLLQSLDDPIFPLDFHLVGTVGSKEHDFFVASYSWLMTNEAFTCYWTSIYSGIGLRRV